MSHHYSPIPTRCSPMGDARLDLTDLYAFPKTGDAGKSILIMNLHPSVGENPRGPTTAEPFAPEALYELKIDTNGDAVADIAYRLRFSSSEGGTQVATLRRVEGSRAAGSDDGGQTIVEGAPVSTGREARVTDVMNAKRRCWSILTIRTVSRRLLDRRSPCHWPSGASGTTRCSACSHTTTSNTGPTVFSPRWNVSRRL